MSDFRMHVGWKGGWGLDEICGIERIDQMERKTLLIFFSSESCQRDGILNTFQGSIFLEIYSIFELSESRLE